MIRLVRADCTAFLRTLDANSVDSVVCDPPYGLGDPPDALEMLRAWLTDGHLDHEGRGFMGKQWDAFVPQPALWREVHRVLKPGGHLLCFAGTRTVDLMGLSVRLAGFEVRDSLSWCFGSGFPKSLDISKALDAATGAEREVGPVDPARAGRLVNQQGDYTTDSGWSAGSRRITIDPPATELAKKYHDWKTCLKPAHEPVLLCRKPLDGTVAANVMQWGTGGLNIGGCRTPTTESLNGGTYSAGTGQTALPGDTRSSTAAGMFAEGGGRLPGQFVQPDGRYPANLLLDSTAAAMLDAHVGPRTSGKVTKDYRDEPKKAESTSLGVKARVLHPDQVYSDSGGVSRYFPIFDFGPSDEEHAADLLRLFYSSKVSRRERESAGPNNHPTLKPVALMAWLCRLVTPPGGVVLDPFMGSGSCGVAAISEGLSYIGVERETEYMEIAQRRIAKALERA